MNHTQKKKRDCIQREFKSFQHDFLASHFVLLIIWDGFIQSSHLAKLTNARLALDNGLFLASS